MTQIKGIPLNVLLLLPNDYSTIVTILDTENLRDHPN